MNTRLLLLLALTISIASCSKKSDSKGGSKATGWKINDKKGGFQYASKFKKQATGPGLVLVEGGTFTMGKVQDDVMHDWNNTPNQQHVQSFYMDETEVTNMMYMEYLDWLKRVYPPDQENYKNIYEGASPDTLVWRNRLGYNETMTNNYLRHPAYADYPVVGVNWIQAVEFSKWRTDRVNENILERSGYLKRDAKIKDVTAETSFNTDTYLAAPTQTFGGKEDVVLKNEDLLFVPSRYDIQEEFYVQVTGEVKNPGTYPFSKQMTAEDLIILAGGLRESANVNDVEIARRSATAESGTFSELIPIKINIGLDIQENPVILQPYDNVVVRRKPNFTLNKQVQIEGQVNSPGIFSVQSAEERISDVIKRAGGLTPYAYTKGATLIRRTEFFDTESEQLRRQRNLQDLQQKLQRDPNNTEAQELLLQRLFLEIGNVDLGTSEGAIAAQSKKEKKFLTFNTTGIPKPSSSSL